jgi:hypothetical protein
MFLVGCHGAQARISKLWVVNADGRNLHIVVGTADSVNFRPGEPYPPSEANTTAAAATPHARSTPMGRRAGGKFRFRHHARRAGSQRSWGSFVQAHVCETMGVLN